MATVLQEEDKDKELQQAPPPTQAPVSAPSAQAQPQRQGSGRFVNIQKYIQANQGANKLGEQIQGKIGGEAESLRQGIQQSQQKFQQQAAPEQQRLAQAGQTIQSAISTAQTAPSNLSPEQLSQFQALREGQLNAPTGLENVSQLQQQQQALGQKAALTGTEAGRFELLRQYFGKPTYTRGQQKLDQLLLQSGPGSLRQLQQGAQASALGTGQALTGVQQSTQDVLNQLAQQKIEAQKMAQEQVSGAQTGLQSDIENEAQRQTQMRQNIYNQLSQERPNLTAEDLKTLGLDPSMQMYHLGLKDLQSRLRSQELTPGLSVSKEQAVTPEQMARLNALSQLSGTEQSFISGPQQAAELRPFDIDALKSQAASDIASRADEMASTRIGRDRWAARHAISEVPEYIRQMQGYIGSRMSPEQIQSILDGTQRLAPDHSVGSPQMGDITAPNAGILPNPAGALIGAGQNLVNTVSNPSLQNFANLTNPTGSGGMRAKHIDWAGRIQAAAEQYRKWQAAHPTTTLGDILGVGKPVSIPTGEERTVLPPGVRS